MPPFFERDAMAFLRDSGLKVSAELERENLEEAREMEQTLGLIRPITINLFGLVALRFEALPKNYRNDWGAVRIRNSFYASDLESPAA